MSAHLVAKEAFRTDLAYPQRVMKAAGVESGRCLRNLGAQDPPTVPSRRLKPEVQVLYARRERREGCIPD